MKHVAWALFLWLPLCAGLARPQSDGRIVAPGAALEKAAGGCRFTEGPAADGSGNLFFSDGPNNRIMKLASDGTLSVYRQPALRANGTLFDAQGRLLTCNAQGAGGGRSVTRIERDGTVTVLASHYDGKRLNSPNDLCVDRKGRIYFTDPRYGDRSDLEQDRMGVYRIDPDGAVTRIIDDLENPNGIVISRDERTLYIADNNPEAGGSRRLYAYKLSPDGSARRSTVLHDFSPGRGVDGMVLDEKGNVYATAGEGGKSGVYVFSRAGKLLTFIATPETATNCTFGGPDLRWLYVTAGESVYRIRTSYAGHLAYPRIR